MNEDIKKYEAKKGKSREEILQAEKTNKKRATYIHWIVTFSLVFCYIIWDNTFETNIVGTTFLDNILGNIGYILIIPVSFSVFIWVVLAMFFKPIAFSKVVMWTSISIALISLFESLFFL